MASHAIYRQTRVKTYPRFFHPHAWLSPSAFPFYARLSGLASYNSRPIHRSTAKTLPTLTDGLVAYWNMNEVSGTTVADSAGGNNGTASGSIIVPGPIGNARKITSTTTDKIDFGFGIPKDTTFSVAFWLKVDDWIGPNSMIMYTSTGYKGWIVTSELNTLKLKCYNGVDDSMDIGIPYSNVPTGVWHMVAFTISSNDRKMYLDGTLVAADTTPATIDNNQVNSFWVGPGPWSLIWGVDELRYYNRLLGGSEVLTLYQQAPDVAAPVISGVTASTITTSTAVITWTTDENSTSVVEYGPTTTYGQLASVSGSVTNHSVNLSGLASGTTYHTA